MNKIALILNQFKTFYYNNLNLSLLIKSLVKLSVTFFYLLFYNPLIIANDNIIQHYEVSHIVQIDIQAPISPATLDYLEYALKKSLEYKAQLFLINLNTPGGLVTTTKDILALIGESEIPIVIWVTPEGASATSAGAIIASGAHLLIMSEGTNIGAATPIQMSGDIKEQDLRNKAVNDLVALIESLSELRGRNPKHYAEMISKASSFKSREALSLGIIDGIINNTSELFTFLDGKEITIKGAKSKIKMNAPTIQKISMTFGQELLNIFANPSLAYLLLLAGVGLIYLEFQTGGGFIAGSGGLLCLIMAGISFQVLPLNMGALGLIILGMIFFIAEIYITSFGVISLMGLASLATGSAFLFKGETGHLELNPYLIAGVVVATGLFLILAGSVFFKTRKKVGKVTFNSVKGLKGIVVEITNDPRWPYLVRVGGENWRAISDIPDTIFKLNDEVIIAHEDTKSMSLKIKGV